MRNCLARPVSTSIIPGPCRMPKPQFPRRPAPTGVDVKASMLKKCEEVWPAGIGFPTQSGRRDAPVRLAISVFDWSLICAGSFELGPVGLIVGVSHWPLCKVVTVLKFQPPKTELRKPDLSQRRLAPKGSW